MKNTLKEMNNLRKLKGAEKKLNKLRKKAAGEIWKEAKVVVLTGNLNQELSKVATAPSTSYKTASAIQELMMRNEAYIEKIRKE